MIICPRCNWKPSQRKRRPRYRPISTQENINMGQLFSYSLQNWVDSFFLRQEKELHSRANQRLLNKSLTCSFSDFFLQFIHSKIDRTKPCKHFLCECVEIIHNLYTLEEQRMCKQERNRDSPVFLQNTSLSLNNCFSIPFLGSRTTKQVSQSWLIHPCTFFCLLLVMTGACLRSPTFYVLPP